MKQALKNQLKQLESQIGNSVFGDVIFQINGQNEEGDQLEVMVVVNDELLSMTDFKEKYPNFKPSGIEIVLGEWDD